MEKATYNHSVTLNVEKCKGCTNCLRRCPTEAIRIRGGHASIDASRCIDCGECIRVCMHKAKKARHDRMDALDRFKYKIALPAPSLYGQFNNLFDIDYVIDGLYRMGFDSVYEVSRAAEEVTAYTRRYIKRPNVKLPVISSACPAVTRLISLRYPSLCEHLLPIKSPMEIAAIEARRKALEENPGLRSEDIGVAFISPCPAKISFVKNKDGQTDIDVVLSMSEVYFQLLNTMDAKTAPEHSSESGMLGVGWASSGGESTALFNEKYLAADGIENVIRVLDHLEDGSLSELEFIELNACNSGCTGGVLTVENAYIAQARLTNLRRTLPISHNAVKQGEGEDREYIPDEFYVPLPVTYEPENALGLTFGEAFEKMSKIEKIYARLPDHDCGSCGSPTCRSFAEDVVKGEVTEDQCIVNMRALIDELAKNMDYNKFGGDEE